MRAATLAAGWGAAAWGLQQGVQNLPLRLWLLLLLLPGQPAQPAPSWQVCSEAQISLSAQVAAQKYQLVSLTSS